MACKIGIDKKYRPQPAPCRWGKTYRCERRNSIKSVWTWQLVGSHWIRVKVFDRKIWGSVFYSNRHLVRYCEGRAKFRTSKRSQLERFTQAVAL